MNVKESAVEKRLRLAVIAKGGRVYKFISSEAGVPDRIVLYKRKAIFVETKRPIGGEVSRIQRWQHSELAKQGFEVWVLSTYDEVDAFIDGL